MQSKEELERCIKEQEVSKGVSLPKTDDLVDEVALHLKHISLQYLLIFSQVAALQDENTALRTKIEVLEEESMKKVIFTINRTKDQSLAGLDKPARHTIVPNCNNTTICQIRCKLYKETNSETVTLSMQDVRSVELGKRLNILREQFGREQV